jgi:hypothetical protein
MVQSITDPTQVPLADRVGCRGEEEVPGEDDAHELQSEDGRVEELVPRLQVSLRASMTDADKAKLLVSSAILVRGNSNAAQYRTVVLIH